MVRLQGELREEYGVEIQENNQSQRFAYEISQSITSITLRQNINQHPSHYFPGIPSYPSTASDFFSVSLLDYHLVSDPICDIATPQTSASSNSPVS